MRRNRGIPAISIPLNFAIVIPRRYAAGRFVMFCVLVAWRWWLSWVNRQIKYRCDEAIRKQRETDMAGSSTSEQIWSLMEFGEKSEDEGARI